MPSTTEFVADFFSDKGVYRYLSELYEPAEQGAYKIQPHNVAGTDKPALQFKTPDFTATSVRVIHGGFPSLAWRIEIGGKSIVFSGDTNGAGGLVDLAANADLFIAHNAVPEGVTGVERNLHMPPSVIGQIAGDAHVKHLVLSHRMLRARQGSCDDGRDSEAIHGAARFCERPRLLRGELTIDARRVDVRLLPQAAYVTALASRAPGRGGQPGGLSCCVCAVRCVP